MTEYYDAVLGLIPLALVGIAGVLTIAGFDLTTAIQVGALVSVGVIGHAMFVNAPVDSVETDATTHVDATNASISVEDSAD
ncbi:MAG: hypothetical protein ACI9YT_001727 [Halobacteriales archaeon]|jgi:hypothetical protein